jgi:cytochrome P450
VANVVETTPAVGGRFDHAEASTADLLQWVRSLVGTQGPIRNSAYGGFWVVARHEHVMAVTRDHEHFSSAEGTTLPPLGLPVPAIPAEADEPDHHQYRSVIAPFLTPTAVRAHEPALRAIVTEALDDVIGDGRADLIPALAVRLPVESMAPVLGFDREEGEQFCAAFNAVLDATASGILERQMEAVGGFLAFVEAALAEARARPLQPGNVCSAIAHGTRNGEPLTSPECVGLVFATVAAAVDTTRHAIGHAVHRLATRPDIRAELLAHPELIPAAVEEALRLDPPAFTGARTVRTAVTLAGCDMQPGDKVLLVYGSANRDAAVFDRPEEFVVNRSPNRHLTFGYGIHTCVGLHLGRSEVRIAMEELLARMPDLELDGECAPPRLRGGLIWGFDSLPVRFTPGTPVGAR